MRLSRKALVPGTLYHVIQRGQGRGRLFLDDADRREFLWILGTALDRHGAKAWAWCLMDNHVHLLLRDGRGNLSDVLRYAFGNYGRRFSMRHGRFGHVFQGRARVFVIVDEAYLSAVIRYIVVNPVKAGVVPSPADWPWSSHAAMVGRVAAPTWFARERALEACGGRVDVYEEHVLGGLAAPPLRWEKVGKPL